MTSSEKQKMLQALWMTLIISIGVGFLLGIKQGIIRSYNLQTPAYREYVEQQYKYHPYPGAEKRPPYITSGTYNCEDAYIFKCSLKSIIFLIAYKSLSNIFGWILTMPYFAFLPIAFQYILNFFLLVLFEKKSFSFTTTTKLAILFLINSILILLVF